MTNIFIANLDFDITSDDLKNTFSQFGEVSYAHVVYDNKTKRSKGFGYIEMEDTDQAIAAIKALNGLDVNGRKLDVKIASPKGSRPEKQETPSKKFEKKTSFERPNRVYDALAKDAEPKRVLRPRRKKS
jgi:RNA recognition motif-containing protein